MTSSEFPFGDEVDTLVVCRSCEHVKVVAGLFQLKARYVTPFQALLASGYNRIIVFKPDLADVQELLEFKAWVDSAVRCRLYPNGKLFFV